MSETSPVLTTNSPGNIRFGAVGKTLFNVDIKIEDDGEILAKGPNIMIGYYNIYYIIFLFNNKKYIYKF